jgi:uncharacterized protein
MSVMHASVATAHGSRYLQQLCKHWSHRFPVEFDPAKGRVELTGATCRFEAFSDRLEMTLEGDGDLDRLATVVTEHLKRFAFREELEVSWPRF